MNIVVYHDFGKLVKIGPLGFFRPGDRVKVRGLERTVVTVDLDGMANAYTLDIVQMHDEHGEPTRSIERGVELMRNRTHGYAGGAINERQREQCVAIAARGERMRAQYDARAA